MGLLLHTRVVRFKFQNTFPLRPEKAAATAAE